MLLNKAAVKKCIMQKAREKYRSYPIDYQPTRVSHLTLESLEIKMLSLIDDLIKNRCNGKTI